MNPLTLQSKAIVLGVVALMLVSSHTWMYFQGRHARDNEVKVENAKTAATMETKDAVHLTVEQLQNQLTQALVEPAGLPQGQPSHGG